MWSLLLLLAAAVLYPAPAWLMAMSALSFAWVASLGVSELRGQHMPYSKFWHAIVVSGSGQKKRAERLLPSRAAMLMAYAPSTSSNGCSRYCSSTGTAEACHSTRRC